MRILLFGANGQVGSEFQALKTSHGIIAVTREMADLSTAGAAELLINDIKPDAIVNAAAYTAVDKAEEEQSFAASINTHAVGEISNTAKNIGAAFIHISTDYVFDGTANTPYKEEAPANPQNVYGATKLDGEIAALANNPDAFVLRTSWVYSPHGNNFVKTMIRLGRERDALTIVDDQIGGPTPASSIAAAAMTILNSPDRQIHGGVYHFQGAPLVSWAGFAEAVFAAMKSESDIATKVDKIPSSDYPTPAKRPLYTVLDCSRILRDFGIKQPDWQADVAMLVKQLGR